MFLGLFALACVAILLIACFVAYIVAPWLGKL